MTTARLADFTGLSKAEVLARLTPHVSSARILPLHYFTVADWRHSSTDVLASIKQTFGEQTLIVRSSSRREDQASGSLAGYFLSVADVRPEGITGAIEEVIASFGDEVSDADQVLVQPMLDNVSQSGVAFSADPNTGAPYRVINLSDGRDTAQVTGGYGDIATWVVVPQAPVQPPAHLRPLLALLDELEALLPWDAIDLEFAVQDETLYLLQARPLQVPEQRIAVDEHRRMVEEIARRIAEKQRPHPFVHGKSAVYGVMPDWNPAEIIGIRPRPLALSLYKELVTDSTWAYQRHNYGYHNLRSHPLMLHFHGQPYIDVRASFNSFLPRDIDGPLAARLIDYYTGCLVATPSLHDKVEFEIVFSCYTLDLPQRLKKLDDFGFSTAEQERLAGSLRDLTNRIIDPSNGLWRTDEARLQTLVARHREVMAADFDPVERIYWLIEDCKRYGTLPFAGLARAGFIAVQMLRSLVATGVFSQSDYNAFMGGLNTVSRQLGRDLAHLDQTTFLAKYGHLRPGTYDILSPRYDEAPELYFSNGASAGAGEHEESGAPFALTLRQLREISQLLGQHGLSQDVVGLFEFLQAGIELREYGKFLFTRNLSDALSLFRRFGETHGFSAEDMSYADIRVIHSLHASCADPRDMLARSIEQGRARHAETCALWLPPLLTRPEDAWAFNLPNSEPNFITQKRIAGPVVHHQETDRLEGAIVFIPSADPGFDWLFSHPIAGLVTAYGGTNSHMAIRASELGLPAVIGAGEALFSRWEKARLIQLDCAARKVDILA
jgi:phosphohistidine swiveling domain-containing protein